MKVRVASAGTGKTTSLVLRYLELIGSGVPLRRVAGVTFTRAAADELRQRVGAATETLLREGRYLDAALAPEARPRFEEARRELAGATLTTIHGFMIDALRLAAPLLGLDPDFGVVGEWEAQAMFEEELRSLAYLARAPEHGLHADFARFGDRATELLVGLFRQRSLQERFLADDEPEHRALVRLFEAAYGRFELRLGAARLSPSEIERRALRLIRHPQAVGRLTARYRLVLVDEFQDVNPLQGVFFETLERAGIPTEVVGDPKQSIYGFRNADVGVFRRARAEGEELPPLTHTRRHARVVCRFLNRLTQVLAAEEMGFSAQEAPPVEPRGAQAEVEGRVELHWVAGDAAIDALRQAEARVLAERLMALHRERGYAYGDMAVLARAYTGLRHAEAALTAAGVPSVLLQGRGYFERSEVRDLYHALRVGVRASGLSLAAWLRGPYGQLPLAEIDAVLQADDPERALAARQPEVHERLAAIREAVRGPPLAALKFLIREPFVAGRRYVDFLDARARENVDALLFTVAQQPPGDLSLLLERLDLLSRQEDAGDVPQSGEGVQLLTVHKAKGLEWPVVAVFDLGRKPHHQTQPLYLDPSSGRLAYQGTPHYRDVQTRLRVREEEESYRLLYVAASRPRDVLLLTGSVKGERAEGWMKAVAALGLGPGARSYDRPDFVLQTHPYREARARPSGESVALPLVAATYIDRRFPREAHPPVQSPSRLKGEMEAEPLPFADPEEGERLPGRATTVGTLTHYAISQNWTAGNPVHLENLRAQEVMFPFTPAERSDILGEVAELLANYEGMLGKAIPALAERSADHPELPMALPVGTTVWQGVIDRLYCAGGRWYLEDYKTDREVRPEHYHVQLGVYLRAIRAVRGVEPEVRLVYLRFGELVVLGPAVLEAALTEVFGGSGAEGETRREWGARGEFRDEVENG